MFKNQEFVGTTLRMLLAPFVMFGTRLVLKPWVGENQATLLGFGVSLAYTAKVIQHFIKISLNESN